MDLDGGWLRCIHLTASMEGDVIPLYFHAFFYKRSGNILVLYLVKNNLYL